MFFYGKAPVYPCPETLSNRDDNLYKLEGEKSDGSFTKKNSGLDFLLKKFMGKNRAAVNNVSFFDFERATELADAERQQDRSEARREHKQVKHLEKELQRKEQALAETAALLTLRKNPKRSGETKKGNRPRSQIDSKPSP